MRCTRHVAGLPTIFVAAVHALLLKPRMYACCSCKLSHMQLLLPARLLTFVPEPDCACADHHADYDVAPAFERHLQPILQAAAAGCTQALQRWLAGGRQNCHQPFTTTVLPCMLLLVLHADMQYISAALRAASSAYKLCSAASTVSRLHANVTAALPQLPALAPAQPHQPSLGWWRRRWWGWRAAAWRRCDWPPLDGWVPVQVTLHCGPGGKQE